MGVHREEPLGNRGGMWFKDGKVLTDEFGRTESGEDLGNPSVVERPNQNSEWGKGPE